MKLAIFLLLCSWCTKKNEAKLKTVTEEIERTKAIINIEIKHGLELRKKRLREETMKILEENHMSEKKMKKMLDRIIADNKVENILK